MLDNQIISAPVIRDAILGGSGVISGNFTTETARDLAILLRAGALAGDRSRCSKSARSAPISARTLIEAGKRACVIAIVFIAVAMILLYGLFGVFANLAMVLNGVPDAGLPLGHRCDTDLPGHCRHGADPRHGGRRQRADP